MRTHIHCRRRGATLTEILVVICIITVLTTLGFYAFSAAKGFADRMEGDANNAIAKLNKTRGKGHPLIPNVGGKGPTSVERPRYVNGEYFVEFSAAAGDRHAAAARLAALAGGRVVGVYPHVINGFGLKCHPSKIDLVKADPAVGAVEQALAIYPTQLPLNVKRVYSNGILGQTTAALPVTMYGAPPSIYRMVRHPLYQTGIALRVIPVGGVPIQDTTVGIMDTGIDFRHPALVVFAALDFTGSNNVLDTDGHGTHIAGVVGAVNEIPVGGIVGVYPACPLISLKVMTGVSAAATPNDALNPVLPPGSNLAVYGALTFVIDNPGIVPICLMPFQTVAGSVDTRMNALVNQAANAGVLMIAAAGNDGLDISLSANAVSPATASGAIAVGAILDGDGLPGGLAGAGDDTLAAYSNYGRNVVQLAAPGGSAAGYFIYSSTPPPSGVLYSFAIYNGGVARAAQGTSFAAAHVAGMMALMRDPQMSLGFSVGGRSAITSYRPLMSSRSTAVHAIIGATHQSTPFRMFSPLTGSEWVTVQLPGGFRIVTPYEKSLYNDVVTDPAGNVIPVTNFYVNPGQAPTNPSPSNLPAFPG